MNSVQLAHANCQDSVNVYMYVNSIYQGMQTKYKFSKRAENESLIRSTTSLV